MDLVEYRNQEQEKQRTADLMRLVPDDCHGSALDIGARDGWFSTLLAEQFDRVIALDLEKPVIDHPRIECIKGDATNLEMADETFDLVFCAEVLEHIPSVYLAKVCSEIERVAARYILIGVPYKQDIRVGQTTCYTCGERNPPWGHVNSFDERRLQRLFASCEVKDMSFVGENRECTNALSAFLLNFAGNPYGSYLQEEPCIQCGARLLDPPERNILQKISTRLAYHIQGLQLAFHKPHANWIHVLFEKRA